MIRARKGGIGGSSGRGGGMDACDGGNDGWSPSSIVLE